MDSHWVLLIVITSFVEMPMKAVVANATFVTSKNTPFMTFAMP
jgi:hypothetical protein